MAYIGKKPSDITRAIATYDTFTGDGSTVAFTLTQGASSANDLTVVVNNVRQEPGSSKSYTLVGRFTLTFNVAPEAAFAQPSYLRGAAPVIAQLAVPRILRAVALARDALSAVVALCAHGQQLGAHLARLGAELRPSSVGLRAAAHVRRALRVGRACLPQRQV